MPDHQITTTDTDIDAAFDRAKLLDHEPLAKTVEHIHGLNLLIIGLTNHRRLVLPLEDLQGLGKATHQQLQNFELLGRGTGISFPDLDVDLYVPALIEGLYGNRRWMAHLGSKGGSARSAAKRRASQTNGTKGGRPKTAMIGRDNPAAS